MLKIALDLEVVGRRRCVRKKMTSRKQVVKQVERIGLKNADAIDRSK